MGGFPDDFYWGSATASHQVEGNNKWNDWWRWEQEGGGTEPSEEACNHYERYREDLDYVWALQQNAHRFSIEWSRIEREEGEFQEEEIQHYKNVVEALRERNIEPFMTLHHFTNPVWFADKGGWAEEDNLEYFYRFVERVSEEFDVKYWITINEPAVYCFSYLTDTWPTERSIGKCFRVGGNLLRAHSRAREILLGDDSDRMVGLAKNIQIMESGSWVYNLLARLADRFWNGAMLGSLKEGSLKFPFGAGDLVGEPPVLDYIGVNYYTRALLSTKLLKAALSLVFGLSSPDEVMDAVVEEGKETTLMGYEVYPPGLRKALDKAADIGVPIYITENGISTNDDSQRQRFLISHLKQVAKAIEDGLDIKGYFHWSTMDNFEWQEGYKQRFGLIGIDYETQERKVRESAKLYREIIEGEVEL